MAEIKSILENLGISADEATVSAILTQLSEKTDQATQASAIHIDL